MIPVGLRGVQVSTDFPGEPHPRKGEVVGEGGPWRVKVKWDDGTSSVIHVEDVIFE